MWLCACVRRWDVPRSATATAATRSDRARRRALRPGAMPTTALAFLSAPGTRHQIPNRRGFQEKQAPLEREAARLQRHGSQYQVLWIRFSVFRPNGPLPVPRPRMSHTNPLFLASFFLFLSFGCSINEKVYRSVKKIATIILLVGVWWRGGGGGSWVAVYAASAVYLHYSSITSTTKAPSTWSIDITSTVCHVTVDYPPPPTRKGMYDSCTIACEACQGWPGDYSFSLIFYIARSGLVSPSYIAR